MRGRGGEKCWVGCVGEGGWQCPNPPTHHNSVHMLHTPHRPPPHLPQCTTPGTPHLTSPHLTSPHLTTPHSQVLEVETFIPMLLQPSQEGKSRLKRVVLIGDHNQLPPVVQNMAIQVRGGDKCRWRADACRHMITLMYS